MTDRSLLLDTQLHLDGVPVRVTVTHWGHYAMGTVYHFEYQSLSDPRRPIPVSETGYKSDFLAASEPLTTTELEEYAETFCSLLLSGVIPEQPEQPSLFD